MYENFPLEVQKLQENQLFFKKKSPKPSSGFAECSFVTPWRNFWPKNQKDGQNMEEVGKPWYSQNYFFSIFFPRHVNCGFENPIVNCLLTAMNSPPPKNQNSTLRAQNLQENNRF